MVGDLQQLPAVSEVVTDTNVGDKSAEDINVPGTDPVKLHEIVVDLTAKRSTENPKGSNFVIGDSLNLPNGKKARTRANIEAIKLVKKIAAEGRIATTAEQEILSKYVGWGGLADAFGKPFSNNTTRKIEYEAVEGLEAEFEELKTVLTEEEYKSARESTKNAHYTSIEVIKAMYDGLMGLGIGPERIWMEDRATSTWENLHFALDLIEEKTGQRPKNIGLLSSEYHLFRAKMFARACNVEAVGIPAHTSRISQMVNHFMREVAGVWHYIILGGQYHD